MALSGNRIADARASAGLTRTMLGAIIGRSEHSILSYELGRVVPPTAVVSRIASVCGVAPGDLFDDDSAADLEASHA